jgi:MarR family transcriptional regulator, 2-MHQ and catechol-resistance regulon repressor
MGPRPEPKIANPSPTLADDLTPLRDGIASHCKNFGACDFDSVNAVVTLKRTSIEFENFISAYFRQYDLSPGRFNILMALYNQPKHTQSLSELGDYLVVTRANITGLVEGLVEDGMLRRLDQPDDRRVVLAQLTDKAVQFLNWFTPMHHKNIKQLMSTFSPDEKRELVALCDKLRAQMRNIIPLMAEGASVPQAATK